MDIFATHIFIQFDERLLPGLSPAQAPCAEELQMPQDLVDNGNLLKSHPCAMKLAVEMIHTLFFLLVHCDFKKLLSEVILNGLLHCTWQRTTLANYL
jgi:hypothetical protein